MQLAARFKIFKMAARLNPKQFVRFFRRNYCNSIKSTSNFDWISNLHASRPVGAVKNIKGWVKSYRKMKGNIFIDVNDGSCATPLQVIFPKTTIPKDLTWGSSIDITGKLQLALNGHQLELSADTVNVIGKCDVTDGYPFVPRQKQTLDYCRLYLHLRLQTRFFGSLLRIRHTASMAVHKFFDDNRFTSVHTPVLTCNDCEGAGEVFTVQPADRKLNLEMKKEGTALDAAFFNDKAYLTVSGQFHLEVAARSFRRVYTFNPTFRAENSSSRLHLSEFYMIEAEEGFVNSIEDILKTMEELIKSTLSLVISKNPNDIELILKFNEIDTVSHLKLMESIIEKPFTVMTYAEALNILEKNSDKIVRSKVKEGLSKEQELFLVEHNNNVPIFVINWPKSIKPFYMKATDHDSNLVSAVDLLVPNVGELCGGSLREDNYSILESKLKNDNLLESLGWYLELRKFGNVPTGGFGLGFERFLQFLLNIQNIKDTIPFPRTPHNLKL